MIQGHLENIIQNYGLSHKESKVYLTILELGVASVSTIARRSGIKRVTIYAVIESLKKQKIASETEKNNIKHYSVISPSSLFSYYEEKYEAFKKHLPELMELPQKFGNTPTIQFFDGQESVEKMLYDYSDTWIQSISQYDKTRWGHQDEKFVEYYLPWLQWHRSKQVPGEKISLLSNASRIEKEIGKKLEKTNNRVIKIIPEGVAFDSTIWVLGDYIIMITAKNSKHHAFQIHDKTFARNLREVFKLLRNNYGIKMNH